MLLHFRKFEVSIFKVTVNCKSWVIAVNSKILGPDIILHALYTLWSANKNANMELVVLRVKVLGLFWGSEFSNPVFKFRSLGSQKVCATLKPSAGLSNGFMLIQLKPRPPAKPRSYYEFQ